MNPIPLIQSPLNATFAGDDEFLIYNLSTGKLHRLNNIAALVIELCDGNRAADEIVGILASVQSLDSVKCQRWVEKAIQEHLLISGNAQQVHASNTGLAAPKHFAGQAQRLRDEGLILAAFVCQYQAAMLDSECPTYWSELGELAHILGRRKHALQAYQHFLELRPDNAEARHILNALCNQNAPPRAPDDCILQLYSRFSEFYEENMCGDLEYEAPVRIKEQLDRYLDPVPAKIVLELGCGTGLAGNAIRPYAANLSGVDLSPEMVAKCRQQKGLYDTLEVAEITSFLAGEITRGARYDLVIACDTLIYFGDLGQVLKPVASVLKSSGWVIFTVEKGGVAPFMLTDSGRYSHTADHIRSVAADVGLQVVALEEGFLRYEYGEPVTGWAATLRK